MFFCKGNGVIQTFKLRMLIFGRNRTELMVKLGGVQTGNDAVRNAVLLHGIQHIFFGEDKIQHIADMNMGVDDHRTDLLLFFLDEPLKLRHKGMHVLKLTVHAGKADICNFVYAAQCIERELSDLFGGYFTFVVSLYL